MFLLNFEIEKWLAQLKVSGLENEASLMELRDHPSLRVFELRENGLSAERAFLRPQVNSKIPTNCWLNI
ncbi:MAG: hypothetical protein IIC60_05275 [Proteobacteria bacterium]|nr:hypothetical protein [Pseudomonadota bacterium]